MAIIITLVTIFVALLYFAGMMPLICLASDVVDYLTDDLPIKLSVNAGSMLIMCCIPLIMVFAPFGVVYMAFYFWKHFDVLKEHFSKKVKEFVNGA
jgi:TM2 domain-containing membrane protein YozV